MIKAICFDVGGVITKTDWDAVYTGFAERVGIEPAVVKEYHRNRIGELLLGTISLADEWKFFKKEWPAEKTEEAWSAALADEVRTDDALLKIIDGLRLKHRLAVISNVSESRVLSDVRLGLYDHFDKIFLSCRVGLTKPDPRFFTMALSKLGMKPTEALFVDDSETNVLAARALGMTGIVFKDTDQFKHELAALLAAKK